MKQITDPYGRTFKTLRISLLNSCNLGCVYCSLSENGMQNSRVTKTLMPVSGLLKIIEQLHSMLALETIRLTGGEPLLYADLLTVIEGIRRTGIPAIKITSNGFLLERLALPMKRAGLQSINVSLDAVDENVFFQMSRRNNVQRILNGIDAAIDAGLHVKINAVLMKGINENQLLPLLEFAFAKKITIRFLEIMAMGHLHRQSRDYLFSQNEILEVISARYQIIPLKRIASATANYWKTADGNTFGIIANESQPFCRDCNRLRLDSNGNIYGCLSSDHPVSLAGMIDDSLMELKLHEAMLQKQPAKFTGSKLSMLHIGG